MSTRPKRASVGRALCCAAALCALVACWGSGPSVPPPPAAGIVLVLAGGLEPEVALARTPALRSLVARGRRFEWAFASEPDPEAARRALIRPAAISLVDAFRARRAAVGVIGGAAALGLDSSSLDLDRPESFDERAGPAFTAWLRARSGPFLAIVSIEGGEPRLAPPALAASGPRPPLPRIAAGNLGFADRPGGLLHPPPWSAASRSRAQTAVLERALVADRVLGELVRIVDSAAPGAAIAVVGDPPLDQGAHGEVGRRGLFDDTLRSQLVVRAAGLRRPGEPSRRLVSTGALAATLLELAGLGTEPGLGGPSLLSELAAPSARADGEAISSVAREAPRVGRSARSDRWRYTEWPDGSRELYDHVSDPGEHTNLAQRSEHRATIEALRAAFEPARPSPPAASGGDTRTGVRPRNVVLIVVDDLNTRLGPWGAAVKTPQIERLAARGVRFDRAYVPVAMCSPSRVSVLTGWRPERTGIWNNQDPPRPAGAVPLQEHFAAHGSVTAGIGKIFHFPDDFRWDLQEEHPLSAEDEAEDPAPGSELFVRAPGGDRNQPDGQRALRAARLLERYRRRPFFLALGLVRPHRRWVAPARYFDLYPPETVALTPFPEQDLADVPAIAIKTRPQPLPGLPLLGREPPGLVRDPSLRRQAIAAYQACTSFADAQVGVVLEALDRLDLWRQTVVVLMGDNGYHLGEHAGLLRKDTLFEEALHVPLVVVAPGLRPAVVRAPTELLDLYPTILELAGLPPVAEIDGRSLAPLLADPSAPGRGPALSYRRVQPPQRGWSLRTPRHRYTLWPDGSEELYEAGRETENRAAHPDAAELVARLRARLFERVAGGASRED